VLPRLWRHREDFRQAAWLTGGQLTAHPVSCLMAGPRQPERPA